MTVCNTPTGQPMPVIQDAPCRRAALWILTPLILVLSLYPGHALESWEAFNAKLVAGISLSVQHPIFISLVERAVTFLPFGLLVYWRAERFRGRVPLAIFSVGAFALALEVLQCAFEGRHGRATDFILATFFGTIGIALGAWLGDRPTPARIRRSAQTILGLLNVTAGGLALVSLSGADLRDWDCGYPLLVANEFDRSRPWIGRIDGLVLYAGPFSATDVRRLRTLSLDGMAKRANPNAAKTFDVGGEGTANSRKLNLNASNLLSLPSEDDHWQLTAGGIEITQSTMLRAQVATEDFCRAMTFSNEFAVEIIIDGLGRRQGGPARILTQSIGPTFRNFMLGEENGHVVARVRTPINGLNGSHLQLRSDDPVLDKGRVHVVFLYTRGAAHLYVNGVEAAEPLRYYEKTLLTEEQAIPTAALAACLFVFMGMIVPYAFISRSMRRRLAQTYLACSVVPTVVAVTLSAWKGYELDWKLFLAAMLAPPFGTLIGLAMRSIHAKAVGLSRKQAWQGYAS